MAEVKNQNNDLDLVGHIKRIEKSGEEISHFSDSLRNKLILLCGEVEYRKPDAEEKCESKLNELKNKGWKNISSTTWQFQCEGLLVTPAKMAGIPFSSSRSFASFPDEDTGKAVWCYLAFGKMEGNWQFYVRDSFSRQYTMQNVRRELLPAIQRDLPLFMKEFSDFLEEKKKEYLKFGQEDNLDKLLRS